MVGNPLKSIEEKLHNRFSLKRKKPSGGVTMVNESLKRAIEKKEEIELMAEHEQYVAWCKESGQSALGYEQWRRARKSGSVPFVGEDASLTER
jgi:hypothetical protein